MSSASSLGLNSKGPIPPPLPSQTAAKAKKLTQTNDLKVEALMKRSFGIKYGDYNPYAPLASSKVKPIIGILGTSTAGKSSIIAALKAREPQLLEQGIDVACEKICMTFLEKHHPAEIDFLNRVLEATPQNNQIFESFVSQRFKFKEGVSAEDQVKAKEIVSQFQKIFEAADKANERAISSEKMELWMLADLITSSLNNRLSIFDIVEIGSLFDRAISNNLAISGKNEKAYFQKIPLQIALVYCPFHLLTERLQERRRKAEESKQYIEIRVGTFPLFQYANLFGPKKHAGDPVIETITRKMVEAAFDENYDAGIKAEQIKNPDSLKGKDIAAEKIKGREKLLKTFGFKDSNIDTIELTPRFKGYKWLIDTSKVTPDGAAAILQKD